MLLHAPLLGSFEIDVEGKTIPLPSRSTAKTLLAYLFLNWHKTQNAFQIAQKMDDKPAIAALRQAGHNTPTRGQ
jgi:hypothetical protein